MLATGDIVADPARGTLMGNRGCLHDAAGRLGAARWRTMAWISCLLSFKGRKRALMQPGRYTELFFLDEAVAMAAGHRPCAECRRADFNAFTAAWAVAHGARARAPGIDARLHAARLVPGTREQARHRGAVAALPDGAVILMAEGHPALVRGPHLHRIAPYGYGPPLPRPARGTVTVLTPAPLVATLAAGYAPRLHPMLGADDG